MNPHSYRHEKIGDAAGEVILRARASGLRPSQHHFHIERQRLVILAREHDRPISGLSDLSVGELSRQRPPGVRVKHQRVMDRELTDGVHQGRCANDQLDGGLGLVHRGAEYVLSAACETRALSDRPRR
jgi:hypothetical protein